MFRERGAPSAVVRTMDTPTNEYEKYAEFCERLAEQAELRQHRAALLEMAQAWRELANEEEAAG